MFWYVFGVGLVSGSHLCRGIGEFSKVAVWEFLEGGGVMAGW